MGFSITMLKLRTLYSGEKESSTIIKPIHSKEEMGIEPAVKKVILETRAWYHKINKREIKLQGWESNH